MTGRHVVITGGEGDLARAIADELRNAGYEVDAPGRQDLDVCSAESVRRFFLPRSVDLLVCCAGVIADAPLARLAAQNWSQVWETNFRGAKRCADAVLPSMLQRHAGHIVFVSSRSAFDPPTGQTAYATAKRALLGLMCDLAMAHGGSNIRVNTILPGFLDNRMTEAVSRTRRDAVRDEHALRRLNTMDRVAAFLRFLHESMPHTSGQWFQLDSRPGPI